MNKTSKIILISLIAVFGIGVLFVSPTQAQPPPLVIDFQETPLFNKTNFLPGDGVTRWVNVTNNSGENQEIGVNVTGYSECLGTYCLSDELNLVISKNGNPLYTGSLTDFYKAGEIHLSNLPNGNTNQYDFSITFIPETENNYQGLGTSFNFEIGFWGESISGEIPPGGGGGGGGGGVFIAGLEIIHERVSEIGINSVTIIWDTNKRSTSRVIYSPSDQSYAFDWTKSPNYGYLYSTPEYDTPASINGVIVGHTVYITGLETGTTYYYRCVSHTSPDETVSTEHSFTTKGVAGEESERGGEEAFVYEGTGPGPAGAEESVPEELAEGGIEGGTTGQTAVGQEESGMGLGKLLAAIGSFFGSGNLCWLLLLLIMILIVLFLLSVAGKKQEKKKQWILPLIILILIILYSFLSCANYLWLVIIISLSVILFFIFRKRLTKPASTEQP
jgi:hypothetical protein